MSETPLIRLVDDDPAVLQAMSFLLTVENLENQTFASGESFLKGDAPSRPGVVVIDLKMPGMSGMDVLCELKARRCEHPIVILTAHGDVDIAVLAMKAGAFDFLQKPLNPERFIDTIRRALEVDGHLCGDDLAAQQSSYGELSHRERQIVQRVSLGMSNRAIADELNISERTVENHRGAAYRKLHVNNREDLKRLLQNLEIGEREQEVVLGRIRRRRLSG